MMAKIEVLVCMCWNVCKITIESLQMVFVFLHRGLDERKDTMNRKYHQHNSIMHCQKKMVKNVHKLANKECIVLYFRGTYWYQRVTFKGTNGYQIYSYLYPNRKKMNMNKKRTFWGRILKWTVKLKGTVTETTRVHFLLLFSG